MLNRDTLPKEVQDVLRIILNKDLEDLKEKELCFLSARKDYLNSREIETFLESKPIKNTTKKGRK
jgi:hypothetical protein